MAAREMMYSSGYPPIQDNRFMPYPMMVQPYTMTHYFNPYGSLQTQPIFDPIMVNPFRDPATNITSDPQPPVYRVVNPDNNDFFKLWNNAARESGLPV